MPSSSSDSLHTYQEEVLQNTDILITIFDLMSVKGTMDEQEASALRKSLYSIARVCNTFKEPALNALWSVIPSLVPLYRLLPSFYRHDNVYILGYMGEEDWKTFDSYAKRVREIVFRNSSSPLNINVSQYTVYRLFHDRQTSPLPGLRIIRIPTGVNVVNVNESILQMLPARHTETFEFNHSTSYVSQVLPSLLASLPQQTPHLRDLTLTSPSNVTLDHITLLPRLRSLCLLFPSSYIYSSFLKRLGRLEYLETLKLHVGTNLPTNIQAPDQQQFGGARANNNTSGPFSALQKLTVQGNPNIICRIMEQIQPRKLAHFTVVEEQGDGSSTTSAWRSILSCLSCSRWLQSVTINQFASRSWGHPGYSLSLDTFLSLSDLPDPSGLERLIIRGGAISATDDDIRKISSMFCGLKVFKLPLSTFNSSPTLLSLHTIHQNLPRLESLRILLDHSNIARDLKFIEEQRATPLDSLNQTEHPLRKLFLSGHLATSLNQQPESAVTFAQFFDRQFPRLRTMLLPDGTNKEWSMIEKITLALGQKGKETIARRESQVLSP